MFVRVSLGTAIMLGLREGTLLVPPTTGYILLSSSQGCLASCGFCPQAQSSTSAKHHLSRIIWPLFPLSKVAEAVNEAWTKKKLGRICFQVTNYENSVQDLLESVRIIHITASIPISVSCHPLSEDDYRALRTVGVQRVGIAFDAATPDLFSEVKGSKAGGPYEWQSHLKALSVAQHIFGNDQVTTHLIIGLGETEKQACEFMQDVVDREIRVGLFAFTPVHGTRFESREPPPLDSYRRVQIARALIHRKLARMEQFCFDEEDKISSFGIAWSDVKGLVTSGQPFQTSGCPECNRPFYNEPVRGPWYNIPRKLTVDEVSDILQGVLEQNLFRTS